MKKRSYRPVASDYKEPTSPDLLPLQASSSANYNASHQDGYYQDYLPLLPLNSRSSTGPSYLPLSTIQKDKDKKYPNKMSSLYTSKTSLIGYLALLFAIIVALDLLFTNEGESFNFGLWLQNTSPYMWALTGAALTIGLSVLGAGW
jgi:hypothetical protein